ncbi:hypothetical protein [Saccharothrix luteola]|uniref:hypothetical protein n=1 Tax=Saccharothrix luteola TaxID=2893018 RepID=UPI001E5D678B|nr:hypothetical protein [Saccharothrix luteola]MCC8249754.1 hypothetical protein [Saccharothrix luteola]
MTAVTSPTSHPCSTDRSRADEHLDDIGGRLDTRSFTADQDGYRQLLDWAAGFGAERLVFGIEEAGSSGAGPTSARAVLNDTVTAAPETDDRLVEMIGQVKVAEDVAAKARTFAMITPEAVLVTVDSELRDQRRAMTSRCHRSTVSGGPLLCEQSLLPPQDGARRHRPVVS